MTNIDKESLTWRTVSAWAETEIAAAQDHLEQAGLPPEPTEHQRGRIAALRDLLRLTEPAPTIKIAGPTGY